MQQARKVKQATTTFLVQEALERADDFLTDKDLARITGRNMNQVSAALHHLRNHRVVGCVIEPDGRGWWYANRDDDRLHVVEERVPEPENSRKRRAGVWRRKVATPRPTIA